MGGETGIGFMYVRVKAYHSLGDLQIETIHSSIIAFRNVKLERNIGCFQHMSMFL